MTYGQKSRKEREEDGWINRWKELKWKRNTVLDVLWFCSHALYLLITEILMFSESDYESVNHLNEDPLFIISAFESVNRLLMTKIMFSVFSSLEFESVNHFIMAAIHSSLTESLLSQLIFFIYTIKNTL